MTVLRDAKTGEILLRHLETADTIWTRFKGLQLRTSLPPEHGMLITPCSSIHTCFMRFPIDVVMLDRERVVIDVRRNLAPWRVLLCRRSTSHVVETSVGSLHVLAGDRLDWG